MSVLLLAPGLIVKGHFSIFEDAWENLWMKWSILAPIESLLQEDAKKFWLTYFYSLVEGLNQKHVAQFESHGFNPQNFENLLNTVARVFQVMSIKVKSDSLKPSDNSEVGLRTKTSGLICPIQEKTLKHSHFRSEATANLKPWAYILGKGKEFKRKDRSNSVSNCPYSFRVAVISSPFPIFK